jgi:hypothetical protein
MMRGAGPIACLLLAGCGGHLPPLAVAPAAGVIAERLAPTDVPAWAYRADMDAGVLALVPVLPNWTVGNAALGEDQYAISLRMRGVVRGGEGEARWLFNREAALIARAQGYGGYQVVSYGEGIESASIFPQRVAGGVVRLTRPLSAPPAAPAP